MFRIALFALASAGFIAWSADTASAGGYRPYYGGYAPQPYYPPYQMMTPPPAPLPPPPLIGAEGPKYYSGVGYSPAAPACYRQHVRVPDRYGGWTWGVKYACD